MYVQYLTAARGRMPKVTLTDCDCRLCIGPWPKEWMTPSECVWMVPGTVDLMED